MIIVLLVLLLIVSVSNLALSILVFRKPQPKHLQKSDLEELRVSLLTELKTNLEESRLSLLTELRTQVYPQGENEIEKTEPEDMLLDENVRIPMINGMKVVFEGEDQTIPIDIA